MKLIVIKHEKGREELRKECLEIINYCDNDVTAIQLYNDNIDFHVVFRARKCAVPPNPKHTLWSV